MKSRIIYVDETGKYKINSQDFQKENKLQGLEAIEKIADMSGRIMTSSQQIGNVIATLSQIQPQQAVSWEVFIRWCGLSFIAGVILGYLIQKKP